ncbi:hypothetical protein K439DRAFT_1332167 [Ramaria rubella]|nr:hypothetical protein K439DRAFT_1332167 [Ramaria rubella]
MATGNAPIVDANDITPGAPDDDGVNELGKALVRVRERFRRDCTQHEPLKYINLTSFTAIAPAITVPLTSPLNPVSPHKILYKKKLYPTAAHLFEAHKFLKHRPDLAERIRTASDNAAEMGALAWSFQLDGQVRPDWELVWRDKMDEVLYLKFVQHPDLRADLMATGYSPLLDGNDAMAGRPDGEGVNELGKALFRLRERLRREGAR